MIQGFAAFFCRFDKNLQIFTNQRLPDKIFQAVRTQADRRSALSGALPVLGCFGRGPVDWDQDTKAKMLEL